MENVYIWNAITLSGDNGGGIIRGTSRKKVWNRLHSQGYYQVSLESVPREQLHASLKNVDLIYILDSLVVMLDAGISMLEALELLISDRKSTVVRYVFLELRNALHRGKSLEDGFTSLSPLFPDFLSR